MHTDYVQEMIPERRFIHSPIPSFLGQQGAILQVLPSANRELQEYICLYSTICTAWKQKSPPPGRQRLLWLFFNFNFLINTSISAQVLAHTIYGDHRQPVLSNCGLTNFPFLSNQVKSASVCVQGISLSPSISAAILSEV